MFCEVRARARIRKSKTKTYIRLLYCGLNTARPFIFCAHIVNLFAFHPLPLLGAHQLAQLVPRMHYLIYYYRTPRVAHQQIARATIYIAGRECHAQPKRFDIVCLCLVYHRLFCRQCPRRLYCFNFMFLIFRARCSTLRALIGIIRMVSYWMRFDAPVSASHHMRDPPRNY